tara:strand:- start:526 stop:849 length:324 start_codon:yes stop_codon:yes gene_type:complete
MAAKKKAAKKAATKQAAEVKEEIQVPSEEPVANPGFKEEWYTHTKPQHDPQTHRIKINPDTQRNEMCIRNDEKEGWVTSTGSVVPFSTDEREQFANTPEPSEPPAEG